MKLDELSQPGWEDAVRYFNESDKEYGTSVLLVPEVIKPQMDDDAAAPAQTTYGELMECLDLVPVICQMPQGTSRPASCHIRLGSVTSQSDTSIPSIMPAK